jgi:DDE superfamily endonuclease
MASSRILRYNKRHSRARVPVEAAFGKLKGRFRCLNTTLLYRLSFVPILVHACAVLHNLCCLWNDPLAEEEWLQYWRREKDYSEEEFVEMLAEYRNIEQTIGEAVFPSQVGDIVTFPNTSPSQLRDAFADLFMQDGQ